MEPLTDTDLGGCTVLVTGATRGIGRMLAEGLASRGARIVAVARRAEELDETVAALGPERCHPIQADLATDSGIDAVVEAVAGDVGPLDALINNAATSRFSPLDADDHSFARWDAVLRLNVTAPFLLTVRLLPHLGRGDRAARIVNIGSIDGMRPPAHDAHAYAASKAALHHLTLMLAPKLGRLGVLVNAIAPSAFESRMSQDLLAGAVAELEARNPLGRLGSADDIVGMVLFLLSDAGAYVNGAILPLDGGVRLQLSGPARNGQAPEPRPEVRSS